MVQAIDVHNHYYPENYLDALDDSEGSYSLSSDEAGRDVIVSNGSRVVTLTPPMTDLAVRKRHMADAGIDQQLLSVSIPNIDFLEGEAALELAQVSNDAYAEIQKNHDEFYGLACVPLRTPELAVEEARRAIEDLGLKGINIGSNINNQPLTANRFRQFFEAVDELDVPLYIHPMPPANVDTMQEHRLAPLVGFENDLTLAITRLIFDGVLEEFDLDIHVSHLGGTIPFLVERLNNGYQAYPECRENISKKPEQYLREIYYDTVSFHEPALVCTMESVGADQLLLGSDYPHVIGDINRAKADIENLEISHSDRMKIAHSNAKDLYDL
ncbi:amidohydrolase family protein [Haloarchaeobius salinus]|uniref:amidohydrolase family protein n=1 Tax=Haloarchaeobius salinus TaxID=1198298 RepID=UPI00210911CD|nr:amidohydrolase family protein [Haloarchaeobius salinus]